MNDLSSWKSMKTWAANQEVEIRKEIADKMLHAPDTTPIVRLVPSVSSASLVHLKYYRNQ